MEALTWTLVLSAVDDESAKPKWVEPKQSQTKAIKQARVFDAERGDFVDAQVISREASPPGAAFHGPALVVEDQTTVWVPSSFNGRISAGGHVILERKG